MKISWLISLMLRVAALMLPAAMPISAADEVPAAGAGAPDFTQGCTIEDGSTQSFGQMVLAARNTFVIDPRGVIRRVYVEVNPEPHSAEVLTALTELQKGE